MSAAGKAIQAGAIQKLVELESLYAAAVAISPRVIVEIGSDAGGSLLGWTLACPDAEVISLSLPLGPYSTGRTLTSHGVTVISGDSHHSDSALSLRDALRGRAIDVLFVDGDHTYQGVRLDYETYGPLVRPGGIIAFHDICHHVQSDVGVEQLWSEIRGNKAEFITPPTGWGGIGILYREGS